MFLLFLPLWTHELTQFVEQAEAFVEKRLHLSINFLFDNTLIFIKYHDIKLLSINYESNLNFQMSRYLLTSLVSLNLILQLVKYWGNSRLIYRGMETSRSGFVSKANKQSTWINVQAFKTLLQWLKFNLVFRFIKFWKMPNILRVTNRYVLRRRKAENIFRKYSP